MDLRKTVNQMHLGRPLIPSAQPVAPATSCPASSSNHLSWFVPTVSRGPRLTAGPGGPAGPSFPFKPGPPYEPDLGQQVRWEGEASQAGDPKKMCRKV